MQEFPKGLTVLFLLGALLAGCTAAGVAPVSGVGKGANPAASIVPLIDVAQRKAALATIPPDERRRWCRTSEGPVFLTRRAKIRGRLTQQRSNATAAGNALFAHVESYYAGREGAARDIRNALTKGSRIDAFTVLVPYALRGYPDYNAMNEPVSRVAGFMVPLAHAYLILKEEYPGEEELIADVKRWGDALFEVTRRANDDFTGTWRGIDRRAHIAAGWASWGNAASNRDALDDAYGYYLRALAGTGEGGADQVWIDAPRPGGGRLSFVNATLQSALVAAYALRSRAPATSTPPLRPEELSSRVRRGSGMRTAESGPRTSTAGGIAGPGAWAGSNCSFTRFRSIHWPQRWMPGSTTSGLSTSTWEAGPPRACIALS